MGLLDDAIREHMELKRLRGADPSEVARMERDALGPVEREHDPEKPAFEDGAHGDPEHMGAYADHDNIAHEDPALEDGAHAPTRATNPAKGPDFANVGQETAELDMRTVLDGQLEEADPAGDGDLVHPGERRDAGHLNGARREGGEPPGDGEFDEKPVIPGDTPGQERLWFDQQAPRDFDSDQ